jgi:hypothetical protein
MRQLQDQEKQRSEKKTMMGVMGVMEGIKDTP